MYKGVLCIRYYGGDGEWRVESGEEVEFWQTARCITVEVI
jgi:hypothetical protein